MTGSDAGGPGRLLLRGGLVADGIGPRVRPGDVLIEGRVIAAVGPLAGLPGDCAVVDLAPGSVVCPGFIDAHVHAEGPLLADGRVDGALAQGVTTLVVGQDGESWIGATAATAAYLNRYFAPVNGTLPDGQPMSVAQYRQAVSGRLTQNVAVLASQGTIRYNVAGLAPGPLTPPQAAAARDEVEAALAAGAVGLSSGLDYLPSRLGDVAEISGMAQPLADAGRLYVSHLRGYGPQVEAGLAELVAVGQLTGVRVHASHLWGERSGIRAGFAAADAAGVALSYDSYPYRRSSSILAMLVLPPELQAAGPARTLAALADPGQRAALLATEKLGDDFLATVYLAALPAADAEHAGRAISEAAARSSRPPGEWALDLLLRARLHVGAHLDRLGLTDDDLAWLAADPRQCAGSDGIYQGQHPHPRGYGAFASLAASYLSAGPETGYQQLARHLAANAADTFGLSGRGRIAPGHAADLCVIGPDGLTARSTYATPRAPATGIDLVLVNGTIVYRDATPVPAAFPGQLVS
jgi:N-acyl-D-amino-acid deacylase